MSKGTDLCVGLVIGFAIKFCYYIFHLKLAIGISTTFQNDLLCELLV